MTDHFQRQEIVFKTVLACLGKVSQSFFLYPSCPVQTTCILSMVKAWAVLFPKDSFAKKKTSSKWRVFSAQHSLRNISVLPKAIMFHANRTPKLFKFHVLQFFEVVEDYLSMENTVSMYLKNLICLTISMTNMDDY